jgi:putative endonuclease
MHPWLNKLMRYWRKAADGADVEHDRSAVGVWGEHVAEKHLVSKRYKILGRRVRVGPRDELDLIARSPEEVLVFVEVKTRADERYGRPFAAVDARKRRALSRAAWRYLKRVRPRPHYFRFDVIEVIGGPGSANPVVRHIEAGFSMMGRKRWGF